MKVIATYAYELDFTDEVKHVFKDELNTDDPPYALIKDWAREELVDILRRESPQTLDVTVRINPSPTTEKILADDEKAAELGEILALGLRLRRDPEHRDRWQTTWGSKTTAGLARTIHRMLTEGVV